MSLNNKKEDLRRVKTKKALFSALSSLLNNHHFEKTTVTDICEEALISRATFYTYFLDKYDLLKYWLEDLWSKYTNNYDNYEHMEEVVNHYIHENESVLKNLIFNADNETIGILFDFILYTFDLTIEKNDSGEIYPKDVVLSNFYAGGMIFYLIWQAKNRFPTEVQPMNIYLYEMINKFQAWKSDEKEL